MPKKPNPTPDVSHLLRMLLQLLNSRAATKLSILASMATDTNWELIEWSNNDNFKNSADPSRCGGGLWWGCETAEETYAQKPVAADVIALWATISYPGPIGRPPCTSPCVSVLKDQQATWCILRHKVTKEWGLHVSKQCQWECRKPEPEPRPAPRPKPFEPLPSPGQIT